MIIPMSLSSFFIKASLCLTTIIFSCSLSRDPQRREIELLQKGRIKDDTSFVYALPYKEGTKHLLVQGYYSPYTHKNRAALDFKMKRGDF